MCFNSESSISIFFLSTICSIYLFSSKNKYDKSISFLIFSIGLMQLAEYFIWENLKCSLYNNYASKFANIVLALQPIALVYGAYKYNITLIPKNLIKFIFYFYFFYYFYFIFRIINYKNNLCSYSDKIYKFLVWDLSPLHLNNIRTYFNIPYCLSIIILLLFKKRILGLIYWSIISILFLICFIYSSTTSNPLIWKSMWCFFCNIFPILVIIINKYLL